MVGPRRLLIAVLALWSVGAALAEPTYGGVLRAAMTGEPPTIDTHITTATITNHIGWHLVEGLFTTDANANPIPMLAESYSVSDDGLTYVFNLRKGVKFHNGEEMTSADVVASMERWGRLAVLGKSLFANVSRFEATDDYTVVMELKEVSGLVLSYLASPIQMPAIYPKSMVEEAGDLPMSNIIGTGPYRLVEWLPDSHIRMARFADYSALPGAADGYGGNKAAYLDEIIFYAVPDASTRVFGVEAGDYDFAESLPNDSYDVLEQAAGVDPIITIPYSWVAAALNSSTGPLTDKNLRKAIQVALDMDPIMRAAFGRNEFYRLSPSLMYPEQPTYWNEEGSEFYDQADLEKAKAYLEASDYAGEEIRWVTSQDYDWVYATSLAAADQLKKLNLNIKLEVVDWGTLVQTRKTYDVFVTGIPMVSEPTQLVILNCSWVGFYCNEENDALLAKLRSTVDRDEQAEIFKEVQRLFYEEAGAIKFGDRFTLRGLRTNVQGYVNTPEPYFWNTWLGEGAR